MGVVLDLEDFSFLRLREGLLLGRSAAHSSHILELLQHLLHLRVVGHPRQTGRQVGHAPTGAAHGVRHLRLLLLLLLLLARGSLWLSYLERLSIAFLREDRVRVDHQGVLRLLHHRRQHSSHWSAQELLREANNMFGDTLSKKKRGHLVGKVITIVRHDVVVAHLEPRSDVPQQFHEHIFGDLSFAQDHLVRGGPYKTWLIN